MCNKGTFLKVKFVSLAVMIVGVFASVIYWIIDTQNSQNYWVRAMTYSFLNPISGETVYHSGSEIGELSLFEFALSDHMRNDIWITTVAILFAFIVIGILIYAFYYNQELYIDKNGIRGIASKGKKIEYSYAQISSVKKSFLKGVTIKTVGQETINYRLLKNRTQIIEEISVKLQNASTGSTKSSDTSEQYSVADQLYEYKTLLDNGVITQEEFDAKKKQLLGL